MTMKQPTGPVLFHVQHLLGVGHLRRAAALCRTMAARGLDVVLVSGGMPLPNLDIGGARLVQLPPVRAVDATFSGLVDENHRPIDTAFKEMRRDRLLSLFHDLAPCVVIFELFPFGRRQLAFELRPLLEAARRSQPRPAIISSVRDVLVTKRNSARLAEMADLATHEFDQVLVHGDPAVIPFKASFPLADRLGDKLRHTGYLVESPMVVSDAEQKCEVIVSAGGSNVGFTLLHTAIRARAHTVLKDAPWRILAADALPPEQFDALAAAAAAAAPGITPGITVERARADFRMLLAKAALSVSQAGYNTAMDVLGTGVRSVMVPFADAGETEQRTRAEAWHRHGLVEAVDPDTLSPLGLAGAIDRAVNLPPPDHFRIDCSGFVTTTSIIADWVAARGERS